MSWASLINLPNLYQHADLPLAEHYFEMSHVDATTALKIYKTFCRDTEKVVAYLGIAKKLQNVTHIQIPNLKHVSSSQFPSRLVSRD
jgi:hypothetical protein